MSKENKRHQKRRIAPIVMACVLAALLIVCAVYVNNYYHADDTAQKALQTDSIVTVEQFSDNTIVFLPENPVNGLIFYPGGKVEYTAYAPLLHKLAEQGMLCVLIKMPFNLAVLNVNAADGIQEEFSEIQNWYIGGHSLGGSMAAAYAAKHTGEYSGLILLAAYSTKDLSQSGLDVVSLYGSNDGVLNMEKYEDSRSNLPADIKEYVIEGGCHAQFGSYGRQDKDGTPEISSEEQVNITVQYILEAIN